MCGGKFIARALRRSVLRTADTKLACCAVLPTVCVVPCELGVRDNGPTRRRWAQIILAYLRVQMTLQSLGGDVRERLESARLGTRSRKCAGRLSQVPRTRGEVEPNKTVLFVSRISYPVVIS